MGQVLEARQAENLKELLRGAVQHRAAEFLRPAYDPDESPVEQASEHLTAGLRPAGGLGPPPPHLGRGVCLEIV